MEKHFITALLALVLLAPQTGLEAKSRSHGVKDRDHDAEERDDDKNKRHRSNRYSRYKKYIKKYRHSHATKVEFELLKQSIAEINAKMDALEPQSQLPADLAAKLDALQMAVDGNSGAIGGNSSDIGANTSDIGANTSDVSLAMSDIDIIFMEIVKIADNAGEIGGLKIAVAELRDRLDLLEPIVEDHESRIFALENPAFVGVSFSALFTQGKAADDVALDAWFKFKEEAIGSFSSITIKNNLPGPSAKCSDPDVATGIAEALKKSLTTTFTCPDDGRLWNVIPYGFGVELNSWTNSLEGQCDTYASVRPFGPGDNWGGIGNSCGQLTQTLEVLLAR